MFEVNSTEVNEHPQFIVAEVSKYILYFIIKMQTWKWVSWYKAVHHPHKIRNAERFELIRLSLYVYVLVHRSVIIKILLQIVCFVKMK